MSFDEASITFKDQSSRSLRVIFDEPTFPVLGDSGEPFEMRNPVAVMPSADVPSNASGAELTVAGRIFVVTSIQPDSQGVTTLKLREK